MSRELSSGSASVVPERGAIALLTILILMAASLVMVSGLSLRGIHGLTIGDTYRRGDEAGGAADGCVDEALRRLRDSASYAGGAVTIGSTTCALTVTDGGGGQRIIHAAATRDSITRHVRAVAQVSSVVLSGRTVGSLTLTTWEETTE